MNEPNGLRKLLAGRVWLALVVAAMTLLVASTFCPRLFSQQDVPSEASGRQPILEVVEISGPEWRSDRYLYLRVFSDGSMEFQDPMKIDLTNEIPIVRKKLSEQEMTQLTSVLTSKELQRLSGTYERENVGNIRSVLLIEIARDDRTQALEFVNFDSKYPTERGRAYTADAERLGGLIEKLRGQSQQPRGMPAVGGQVKQPDAKNASRNLIVEVVATDYQAYTQTKYVYARVFKDGAVEYHDPFHVDLLYPGIIHKQLPPQGLAQLRRILSKVELRRLSGEYHGWYGVDTSVRWDFLVPNGEKAQKFVLWNFTYPERWIPDNTRTIPKQASELGCFLMRINEDILHFRGMPERCKEP